jgi:cell division protein FtsQ
VLWTLGAITLVALLAIGLSMSPLLDVEEIQIVGAAPERVAAVERAAGIDVGDSIVTLLPGSVAGKVRHLPWVDSVSVTRDFPTTVQIRVTERQPVAWVRAGKKVLVVDRHARVLWRADLPPPGIPELLGAADVAGPGGQVRPVVLAAVAQALGPELRSRVSVAALVDGTLSAQVTDGPQLRFGAPRNLRAKARVAAAVLAALGSPVAYIDVTVPAAPVSG